MRYDFSRLRGRIFERYTSRTDCAAAMGCSVPTLSAKLLGRQPFTLRDVELLCGLLEIPDGEIGTYFFTPEFDGTKL